jgi:hypothetical protein
MVYRASEKDAAATGILWEMTRSCKVVSNWLIALFPKSIERAAVER